jgi:chromosome segregation ATPase
MHASSQGAITTNSTQGRMDANAAGYEALNDELYQELRRLYEETSKSAQSESTEARLTELAGLADAMAHELEAAHQRIEQGDVEVERLHQRLVLQQAQQPASRAATDGVDLAIGRTATRARLEHEHAELAEERSVLAEEVQRLRGEKHQLDEITGQLNGQLGEQLDELNRSRTSVGAYAQPGVLLCPSRCRPPR